MPKALVALTVYNDAEYLAEAMQSIVEQSFKDFTFLVVDDGSTDASPEIIAQFCKQDARIHCITLPQNQGRPTARNVALETAFKAHKEQGVDYLFWMDGDDISLPQRLERQVAFMNSHPNISVQGTAMQCFHEAHHVVKTALSHDIAKAQSLWIAPTINATTCLRLKDICAQTLRYDVSLARAEDYAFWLDMLFTTPLRIQNTSEILYHCRYFHRPSNNHYHALASQRLLQALHLPCDVYSAQKHTMLATSDITLCQNLPLQELMHWANVIYHAVLAREDIQNKAFLRITAYKIEHILSQIHDQQERRTLIEILLSLPLGKALYQP